MKQVHSYLANTKHKRTPGTSGKCDSQQTLSEALVTETAASSSKGSPAKKSKKAPKPSFFARVTLFLRQVIGEMKKVVTPTRKELVNYTAVVLVFVVIMMAIVTVLDLGFGQAILWVFGGHASTEQ